MPNPWASQRTIRYMAVLFFAMVLVARLGRCGLVARHAGRVHGADLVSAPNVLVSRIGEPDQVAAIAAQTTRLQAFGRFQNCFVGTGVSAGPDCTLFNMHPAIGIDLLDFCKFHAFFFGDPSNSDGDLLPDRCDPCPTDPLNDADGDSVCDSVDLCLGTPPRTRTDLAGCPLCGNTRLDPEEECDPPGTPLCDQECLLRRAGRIHADLCADAMTFIVSGEFGFDNRLARTDGPPHTGCVARGDDRIERDMWMCWTSPCEGTVFARTCYISDTDTKVAVYEGCNCPVSNNRLVACDDDGCIDGTKQSLLHFEAKKSQDYLIRIGAPHGAQGGLGAVAIGCGLPFCPAVGPCLTPHEQPGCGVEDCCEKVCAADLACCIGAWDDQCAAAARGLCTGGFDTCYLGAGSCSFPRGNQNPGCDDVDCCNAVCAEDPYCCIVQWDDVCATREATLCRSACVASTQSCSVPHSSPGCLVDECCAEVCPRDPFCCQIEWDENCVDLYRQHCE